MSPEERTKLLAEAETKLAVARSITRKRCEYLYPTIYGFIPHPVDGFGTTAVSRGMVLIYDPAWLLTCTDADVAGALVHEAMHIVRNHIARSEGMPDKETANDAMDLAINVDLRAAGWTLPHALYPEDFGLPPGLTFEEYYELLKKKQEEQPKPKEGQGGGGGGKPGASPPGQGPKKPDPSQGGEKPGDGSGGQGPSGKDPGGHAPGVGHGKCGGVAGNLPSDLEKQVDEAMGRSNAERRVIAKQTLQEIKNHIQAHGRGSVPASLAQEVEALLNQKSQIRWQDELRHVIKKASGRIEAGGMDYSLARPSKRSPGRGFPRPGLVQYLPEVAFILDTSGSMGAPQILEGIRQTIAVFKSLGIDQAWFLQADAAVACPPKKIRVRDLLGTIRIHGRGGTHFDPALQALSKLNPRPDLAVYLTDGDGHVSYRPKGIEIVWCIVPAHWNRRPQVPWGHLVVVTPDGTKKRVA